ncbi:potassium transporter KefB [Rufibacter quisquiliarum]|uniref:ABC-type dipeptide/oligopeptide/nickel transport system permease subunit n=1 Tax=Rufibacter quisquiliarum TaxID=1549639 RepID=A0A839GV73_9BACT|nr:potassium transporter KefB [Rufibacter quisquiliarum]MBA9078656.1 ABC-type dipeptide/oligopeptide/nickel transport system permease subunit [Rufibacter quisquiliarum]
MNQQQHLPAPSNQPMVSVTPVLVGTVIAFLAISFFVFGVDAPHPEWGQFWQIRPLTLTPLAGAVGGACYSFLLHLSSRGTLNKTLALVLGVAIYLIGLFFGIVLGLDGTMWD